MQIRPERLIADLRQLATIGKFESGVDRPAFSADDVRAREWLRDKLVEAGLSALIDRAGNVYGRMAGVERAVLVGSHTDTVPRGGWLDGSLGVIYGLEIARCFAENGPVNGTGIDVVSFEDEEGTYLALYGSRVFCGEDLDSEIAAARNQDGKPLQAAIRNAGIEENSQSRLDPRRHLAYFEAHIEQGPRLEAAGKRIGVVKAIVGIRTYRILFVGQADHAGTTPMAMRRDAGAAALSFGVSITEKFRAFGSHDTVWNIGNAMFKPGASNVVPSEAQLVLQFRDPSIEMLQKLEEITYETVDECARLNRVECEVSRTLQTNPTEMDGRLARCIEQTAAEAGASGLVMASGAGHDAMTMAKYLPAAMLFVPSIGGRSHHVSEDTAEDDIVLGAQVMINAIELYLQQP